MGFHTENNADEPSLIQLLAQELLGLGRNRMRRLSRMKYGGIKVPFVAVAVLGAGRSENVFDAQPFGSLLPSKYMETPAGSTYTLASFLLQNTIVCLQKHVKSWDGIGQHKIKFGQNLFFQRKFCRNRSPDVSR
ncbi:hypothetical protein RSOLAG1IB_01801 [Rhizoctonia solani AG-1 IB]|uniref:Uncharacterized protein n=1 Tax=Thanatephorus cucumeris (strain AG1-IB / isolate 7/3/14) TaxID=1108050 RepID=A0A0B7FFV0_THACB|nr:hypothetical protein RSOLAG1IB_01801 [Rhizoctonia solani AG-1 IB]